MDNRKFYNRSASSFDTQEEYEEWQTVVFGKLDNFEELLNKNTDVFGNNPKLLIETLSFGPQNEVIQVDMTPELRTELMRIIKYKKFILASKIGK